MRPYCQAHTRSVLIAVYIGNKCYAREYTDITLNADKVYRSNVATWKKWSAILTLKYRV